MPYFQPILSVRQRTPVGAEALARVPLPGGTTLMPEQLFPRAAAEGLLTVLERRCCEKAIQTFADLNVRHTDHVLFINLGTWGIADPKADVHLRAIAEKHSLRPDQIVVEILEGKMGRLADLCELVKRLRQAGFLIALDDVGAGYANLDRIPAVQPDIIKIDRSLGQGIGTSYRKQETLKSVVNLSRALGALVVAEGLETEAEVILAMELGADLLQGFVLGSPNLSSPVLAGRPPDTGTTIEILAHRFKAHMSAKIRARRRQHRLFDVLIDQVLQHLTQVSAVEFDAALRAAASAYPDVECLYVLDASGVQITGTVEGPGVRLRTSVLFRPSGLGTDHSLREYFYLLVETDLPKYTTDPYISPSSGRLTRTLSTRFTASDGVLYVLCVDILAD